MDASKDKAKGIGAGGVGAEKKYRTFQYPYPDANTVDEILAVVREILLKHAPVEEIRIRSDRPIDVIVEDDGKNTEAPTPVLLADILRKTELISVRYLGEQPTAFIGSLLQRITSERGYGCFIAVGNPKTFALWFSQGRETQLREVMGMTIHSTPTLQADTAVVCVAPTRLATPLDVIRGFVFRLDRMRPRERSV